MRLRVPPGRAGRLWLIARGNTAARAAALLERKRELLHRERDRLRLLASRTEDDWYRWCREAESWLLRAVLIGGERELRLAAASVGEAEARLGWGGVIGVAYPDRIDTVLPPDVPVASIGGTAALAPAAAAYRRALRGAVAHGAAVMALQRVEAELVVTSQRLRAIEDRWEPLLASTLHDVELQIDQKEREEVVALRWAKGRSIGREMP
ncbi:MAG: V-type ATP synthase subunit D [Actinomycetota bacterium]